jgi:hypothetical protein
LIEENYGFTLGDVDVLKRMVSITEFDVFECKQWHDIGNVDKMNEAKSQLDNGDIHVLDKLGESIFKVNGKIIKFFYDEVICNNRIKRNGHLKGIVPEITTSAKNFYSYDYVKGDLFANVANNSNFPEFLNWAKLNLWKETDAVSKEKLKELKVQREENEKVIINYLEFEQKDIITIPGFDELNKFTSVRTIPLNQETIKTSLFEKMMSDKIFPTEDLCIQYVDKLYEYMKDKRQKKTKICLKRKKQKNKKK